MSDVVERLDQMSDEAARDALERCGGCRRWAEALAARRPFREQAALIAAADELWQTLSHQEILEAVGHHPRIGADLGALRDKLRRTGAWSAAEQAGVAGAPEELLIRLRDGNLAYERRFGHLFIVCATGKSAAEMLAILEARLDNDPDTELAITAAELGKIMRLRLEKL